MSKFAFDIADKSDPINGRWLDDDQIRVSITHNGYQYQAIACSKAEWQKVIDQLVPLLTQGG